MVGPGVPAYDALPMAGTTVALPPPQPPAFTHRLVKLIKELHVVVESQLEAGGVRERG